jgi:hypothetical protein
MFRAVYIAAGMPMPVLVDIVGHYPWAWLAAMAVCVMIVGLLAWRSRHPAFWLTVEALALGGLVFLLIPILAGNLYRPIYDLDSALRGDR